MLVTRLVSWLGLGGAIIVGAAVGLLVDPLSNGPKVTVLAPSETALLWGGYRPLPEVFRRGKLQEVRAPKWLYACSP